MTPRPTALGLIAPLALLLMLASPGQAQANDMFASKAAAEKRARELHCSGAFAMGSEWMPCQSFEVYEKVVKKESP